MSGTALYHYNSTEPLSPTLKVLNLACWGDVKKAVSERVVYSQLETLCIGAPHDVFYKAMEKNTTLKELKLFYYTDDENPSAKFEQLLQVNRKSSTCYD